MNEQFLQQKWLQTGNGKICYFFSQEFENRPTAVFIHGLSSNHTTWLAATDALREQKLNYLMPDLRGHGYSDKTKRRNLYKFSVFGDDLKKIIEKEKLSQIILIGYSFGGYIALDYAIKNSFSPLALILISANHVNPLKYTKINFLTWPIFGILNLLAWLFLWQRRKKYYYYNQSTATGYWHSTFKGFTTMPISLNFWMLSEIANLDLSRDLAKIVCPTLIIKSKSDPFLSQTEADDMLSKIKSANLGLSVRCMPCEASRMLPIFCES